MMCLSFGLCEETNSRAYEFKSSYFRKASENGHVSCVSAVIS
jgi:hypothetical protein